jgi:hypothetical protein
VRCHFCCEPGEQRGEHRLIRVTPRQPVAGRNEVQFVAVRTVTVDHDQQQDSQSRQDSRNFPNCKPRSLNLLHLTILALTAGLPQYRLVRIWLTYSSTGF